MRTWNTPAMVELDINATANGDCLEQKEYTGDIDTGWGDKADDIANDVKDWFNQFFSKASL